MSGKQTIKKDKTLIEGLVENSKEIINLKNAIHLQSNAVFGIAKCKYRLIESSAPNTIVKELRARVSEIELHNANAFKVAYSHQYKTNFDKLHFSTVEMQAGYCSLWVGEKKNKRKVILFLSDTTPDFLDTIKEGEIREYDENIEKNYLPHCKPVWKSNSPNDLYLERLKLLIK